MNKHNFKHISIELSLRVYPMDAVFGACHRFIDNFYLFLDQPAAGRISVSLVPKTHMSEKDLTVSAGDFANELLHQSLRLKIGNKTTSVREMILGRALLSAEPVHEAQDFYGIESSCGRETAPEEQSFDPDYLDDPLGIAVPWEEKFSGSDEIPDAPKRSSKEESP